MRKPAVAVSRSTDIKPANHELSVSDPCSKLKLSMPGRKQIKGYVDVGKTNE